MLFGFTTKSTLVTLNGIGVGEGVGDGVEAVVAVGVETEPLLPLLPQAAKLKTARQMKTIPSRGCFNAFFRIGCFNIAFLLRGALNTVQEEPSQKV